MALKMLVVSARRFLSLRALASTRSRSSHRNQRLLAAVTAVTQVTTNQRVDVFRISVLTFVTAAQIRLVTVVTGAFVTKVTTRLQGMVTRGAWMICSDYKALVIL
jgi:hypothetical protein